MRVEVVGSGGRVDHIHHVQILGAEVGGEKGRRKGAEKEAEQGGMGGEKEVR